CPRADHRRPLMDDLQAMTKAELIAFARDNGIEVNPRAVKADLIDLIEYALTVFPEDYDGHTIDLGPPLTVDDVPYAPTVTDVPPKRGRRLPPRLRRLG